MLDRRRGDLFLVSDWIESDGFARELGDLVNTFAELGIVS